MAALSEDERALLIATQADVQISLAFRKTLTIPHKKPGSNASLGARQLAQLPSFTTLTAAALPGGGEIVFAGRQTGDVVCWRVGIGAKSTVADSGDRLGAHKGAVCSMAYYERTGVLITGSADCNIKVFDPASTDSTKNRCIQTIPAHDATVSTIATHCNLVITGSADKTTKVWKFDDGRSGLAHPWLSVKQVFIFDAWVTDIWASAHKEAETSAGEVFVADGAGGITVLHSVTSHSDDAEEIIASHLELVRTSGGKSDNEHFARHDTMGPKGIVRVLPIPHMNLLITIAFEDRVRISDIVGLQELVTVQHPDNQKRFVDVVWVSEHEELMLIDNTSHMWLWNTRNNSFGADTKVGYNASKLVGCAAPGSTGGMVWCANRETVQQVVIERASTFVQYHGHEDRILGIYVNPMAAPIEATSTAKAPAQGSDGNTDDVDYYHYATASVDNTICLWTSTMTNIKTYREKYSEISCFRMVPLHHWCITGHDNGSLKFWSIKKDRTFRFVAHDNTVSAIGEGFHRCLRAGQRAEPWHHLFSISFDGCLALWEMPLEGSKAKCEARLRVSNSELLSAVYDTINYWYIVGDANGEVTMWSIDELKPVRSLQHTSGRLRGVAHAEAVTYVALDGNYCFTGGEDSALFLWNTHTGRVDKELHYQGPEGLGEIEMFTVLEDRDGDLLVCTRHGQLIVFSQATGLAILEHRLQGEVSCVCWSRSTEEIVAGIDTGVIVKVHISMLAPIDPPQDEGANDLLAGLGMTAEEQQAAIKLHQEKKDGQPSNDNNAAAVTAAAGKSPGRGDPQPEEEEILEELPPATSPRDVVSHHGKGSSPPKSLNPAVLKHRIDRQR